MMRAGKATASRLSDVLAVGRNGESLSRRRYREELVIERITGVAAGQFVTYWMARGLMLEPEAIQLYETINQVHVRPGFFVLHPTINMSGATPDGFVGKTGLLEIKCLKSCNHARILLTEKIPRKYVLQMHWQMACTGRLWCDFFSYDPTQTGSSRYYLQRIERDDKYIEHLEDEVTIFLNEVEDEYYANTQSSGANADGCGQANF